MRGNDFRRVLDECLERVRGGVNPEECVKAYPEHAERLLPFLRSAATLRELGVPEPSTSGMQRARSDLLTRVAEGSGKEAAVVRGVFKFGNLTGLAIAAVFIAGMSLAAAAGPSLFGGDDDGTAQFRATVISAAPTLLYVQNNDNNQYVYLVLNNQTQYQDEEGNAIQRTDVHVRDRVHVKATQAQIGARFFDAKVIRLAGDGPAPSPTPMPTAPSADVPAPTDAPEATPAPETPIPTDVPATPKPVDQPATPKPTDNPVDKPQTIDFWGVVLAMSDTSLTLQTEWGHTLVRIDGSTQYPNGGPFPGVKVGVYGTKLSDGSVQGHKVTLKVAEFSGTVTGISGGLFTVNADGHNYAVHTNSGTEFPAGIPVLGDTVEVRAFKMGDGSFVATRMKVTGDEMSFTGIINEHMPGELTIKVKADGVIKVVCYEFAEVQGDLVVGATVFVEVDHVDGGTYYAGLVKVMY